MNSTYATSTIWIFNSIFININSVGHHGKFGHEYLEFELRPNGKLTYVNNSHYKKDVRIKKEGFSIFAFFCANFTQHMFIRMLWTNF